MRRRLRVLLPSLALACACLAPSRARADKFDETLDLSVHGRLTTPSDDAIALRHTSHGPRDVGHIRATREGATMSPMLRGGFTLHGFRFGVGVGFEGYRKMHVRYRSDVDRRMDRGVAWGLPFEAFAGYVVRSGRVVRPYVEARGAVTLVHVRTEDRRASEVMWSRATSFALAGQAGVVIHPNDHVFFDLGIGRVALGPGRWTASVGVGIPIPLANL